jgi:hypothetical protein
MRKSKKDTKKLPKRKAGPDNTRMFLKVLLNVYQSLLKLTSRTSIGRKRKRSVLGSKLVNFFTCGPKKYS